MNYTYDIFLSYKRDDVARQWLIDHFQPLLRHYVGLELGRAPAIFRDDQDIEAVGTWPVDLGLALGRSRVLVALWTRMYFSSDWCSRELAIMLEREGKEECRTPQRPKGLIVPVVLHDCAEVPQIVAPVHPYRVDIHDCYNVRMNMHSPMSEALAQRIADLLAPGIARAIEAAPEWRAEWPQSTAEDFLAAVKHANAPTQTQVPGFSA